MSADDLEGDDIWGDGGSGSGNGSGDAPGEESKVADINNNNDNDINNNEPAEDSKMAEEEEEAEPEDEETRHMSISELRQRIHLLSNDIRVMKSDVQRITHESRGQRDRIRENQEKVKLNKQLPYLVANVVEILAPDAEDGACVLILYIVDSDRSVLTVRIYVYC